MADTTGSEDSDLTTTRDIWVTTPLAAGVIALERMDGHETLGQPFSYDLSLVSTDPNIDLSALLGEPMTVHMKLPTGGTRHFNGIVTRASHLDEEAGYFRYAVTLEPWLALLDFQSDCRIFQDMSIPQILKEVFLRANFSDVKDSLEAGAYPELEYVVQYRESDFSFVSRLMEHAGIYYFFKHDETKHTLVLADSQSAHDTVDEYDEVTYLSQQETGRGETEHLSSWTVQQRIRSGSFASTDFDFKAPRTALLSALNQPQSYAHADTELFDYPGGYLKKPDGDSSVKKRLQERQWEHEIVQAAGDVRGIGSGDLFTLTDHPRADQNQEYLVVSATYAIHVGDYESGGAGGQEFHVGLSLLDSKVPFRPAIRLRRHRVEGPQTAIVVGPSGDEIHTDNYGRVRVQFHWDRYGMSDERSSCWVRVAQLWAGSGWGGIHIPRVGQEVIVDFLEGDPDRPIITGRVYNADNMPPYALPANKTQSGIKSRSTQGGAPSNFNEIRFEDKKGSEELHIQAEKDQTTHVKHNQSISVDADRSISVGGNESTSVTGTRTETITKKHTETIHGGREANVDQGDKLTVNGSDKTDTIHGKYDITADTEFQVTQGSNTVLVKDAVDVSSVGEIHLHNAKSSVDLKDGVLTISSATQIVLECGTAKLILKNDGTITIDGSQEVKATGGGSGIDLVAAGATMSGTKATVSGTAMTEITGAMVKIN
jgi:type VI secretion system secreted protein VgrG